MYIMSVMQNKSEVNMNSPIELQNEVIDHWENEGIVYFETDHQSGPSIPPGGFSETTIKPEFQDILDNPELCAIELGYSNYNQWKEQNGNN